MLSDAMQTLAGRDADMSTPFGRNSTKGMRGQDADLAVCRYRYPLIPIESLFRLSFFDWFSMKRAEQRSEMNAFATPRKTGPTPYGCIKVPFILGKLF